MERLIQRIFIFCGVLALMGAAVHFLPKPDRSTVIPEEKLIELSPDRVLGGTYERDFRNPGVSYRMDDESYKVLEFPSAVARVYEVNGDTYDVVIIASRSKDAFHDPNICFAAQGWGIESRTPKTIQTENRGAVPMTFISMYNETIRRQLAAYTYQGPGNIYFNDTNRLKLAFLKEEMFLGNDLEGVFYRFIPRFRDEKSLSPEEKEKKLANFIAAYMDAAFESSNGYF